MTQPENSPEFQQVNIKPTPSVITPGEASGLRITASKEDAGALFITADPTSGITVRTQPPPVFALRGERHELIAAIHPDGRVEIGDGHTTTDAAAAFWHAVQDLANRYGVEQQFGTHLVTRIEAELKAGREAQEALALVRAEVQLLCECCGDNRDRMRRIQQLLALPVAEEED